MAKTGVINARVEQSVRDRLEQYCKDNQIKMAVIVEMALSEWLDKNLHTSVEHNTTQCTQSSGNQTQQELEERLQRLENKQKENYKSIARLQDTYPEYVEETKNLKDDVRTLKYDTQALKINKPSMNDIHNLETVLEQKLDRAYLEGLSCHLSETPRSELPPEGTKQDTPYQLTFTEETFADEAKIDQSENKAQSSDDEGLTATELAQLLGIRKEYITNWKKGKNIPTSSKSKYYSAYQEFVKWELKAGKWYFKAQPEV